VDDPSGYRYYTPAQLPELRRIVALRDLGMGLAEIRALAAGGDLDGALRRRRAELERERAEIDRRLAALGIAIGGGPEPPRHAVDVVVRDVPAEPVATLALSATDGDDEAAFDALEAFVRDRGRRAHRPPGMLLPDDGENAVFVPLTRAVPPTTRIRSERLPAARMATLLHRGGYAGLAASLASLQDWVAATGLRRDGPVRVRYLQFGADRRLRVPAGYVVDDTTAYLTEVQVPVAPVR
jgi:DNA-binding transcriptional MerR regulator